MAQWMLRAGCANSLCGRGRFGLGATLPGRFQISCRNHNFRLVDAPTMLTSRPHQSIHACAIAQLQALAENAKMTDAGVRENYPPSDADM